MLEILTLGGLEILRDGENITSRLPKKGQAMLVYLAYTGREQSREHLATLLWDGSKTKATNSLRAALTAMRKEVDDYLAIDRQTVTTVGDVQIDAERLLHAGELDLYQGEFLKGFSLPSAADFDEWLFQEREWLHVRMVESLTESVNEALEQQQYEQGISRATRLLQYDPYNEHALRQLILLYGRSGNRQEALQQYETFKQRFEEEFGDELTDETEQLAAQIRQPQLEDITPDINLPFKANEFVGRNTELATLGVYVRHPDQHRLITITGPGGAGKTRLAIQLARTNADLFPDGVYFISLASVDSAQGILNNIVDSLQLPVFGNIERQLYHYLQEKQLLLVLDNFEHLVENGIDIVLNLLHHVPNLKLIITSRERLNIQHEWVFQLQGLPIGSTNLEMSAAVQLFMARARQVRYDVEYSEDVAEICKMVGGSPLALELAASWVNMFSPAQIKTRIQDNLDFLSTKLRDVPQRHRSMRAVFDQSWRFLAQREQEMLATLSLFRSSFIADAAFEVAGIDERGLSVLVEKSLISGADRYQLHEVTRTYAHEQLEKSPINEQAKRSYVTYYLYLCERYGTRLFRRNPQKWLNLFTRETANIRVALNLALEMEPRIGVRFVQGIALYLPWQIDLGDEEIYDLARRLMQRGQGLEEDEIYGRAIWTMGGMAWWFGEYDEAVTHVEHFLEIADALGNPGLRLRGLLTLGSIYMSMGDLAQGFQCFDDAYATFSHLLGPEQIAESERQVDEFLARSDVGFPMLPVTRHLIVLGTMEANSWMLTYTMFLIIYQNEDRLGRLHTFDDTKLMTAITDFELGLLELERGDYLWALRLLTTSLILFYAFQHMMGLPHVLRSIHRALSGLGHERLAARSASMADNTRLDDVETLIFDIRELLAQYVREKSYE